MITNRRCAPAWSVLLLVGALGFGASRAFSQEQPGAAFTKGPYLQNLRTDGVTVMWETDAGAGGVLFVAADAAALADWEALMRLSAWPRAGLWRVATTENRPLQELRVTGLKPDTRYFYRVCLGAAAGAVASFRTAFIGKKPFEFVVYGDTRKDPGFAARFVKYRHPEVVQSIRKHCPDARFVIHTGDIVLKGNEHDRWGPEFFDPAADLMADTVIFPAIGNHELADPSYFRYFATPADAHENFYSFDFGNAHFIVLDMVGYSAGGEYGPPAPTPFEPGSAQYEWLVKDLEKADADWIFIAQHAPALCSGMAGNYTPALNHHVPLFEKYGVDIVFAGHEHAYEYSQKDGVAHIITGGGGAMVNPLRPKKEKEKNPWSRFFKGIWHHTQIALDGKKLAMKAIDWQGRTFHELSIDKSVSPKRILESPPFEGEAPAPKSGESKKPASGEGEY